MKDSLKTIWSNAFTLEATNAAIAAENVPEGSSIIPQGIATLGKFKQTRLFSCSTNNYVGS